MSELTKYGPHTNYRVPPESTGTRVAHYRYWYMRVTGLSNFTPPAHIHFLSAGVAGQVHTLQAYQGGHRLLVVMDEDVIDFDFVVDDQVTVHDESGEINGILREWEPVISPTTAITDADQPHHHLTIDDLGAASVRFTEGEPQFDAYGSIRMMTPTRLGDWTFRYTDLSDQFQPTHTNGGTHAHEPTKSMLHLDVDAAAGSIASYISNRFYRFTPGVAQMVKMSVRCGDTGTENVVRRWGQFAGRNGVFFEQTEAGMFCVVRSDVTGSVVEFRAEQADWNGDTVDGTGGISNKTRMNLSTTKLNIYWIDFQWPAGRVRFGTYTPSGKRVTVHSFEFANSQSQPYMLSASLPIRWEIENVGATPSPSRLSVATIGLFREGPATPDNESNNTTLRSWVRSAPMTADNTDQMVGAFRATGNSINGARNRRLIIPKILNYFVGDKPVMVSIYANTVFSGGTNFQPGGILSGAEVSETGTIAFKGVMVSNQFLAPGGHKTEVSNYFNSLGAAIHTLADGNAGTVYTVWVKTIEAADTSTFHAGVEWSEL